MHAHEERSRILIVDDDLGLSYLIQSALEREGYQLRIASRAREAIAWLQEHESDLLVVDSHLPDMPVAELVDELELLGIHTDCLVLSRRGEEHLAAGLLERGVCDYLCKDARLIEQIPQTVRRILANRARDRRLEWVERRIELYEAALGLTTQALAILELPEGGGAARLLYANSAFGRLTGWEEGQLLGRELGSLLVDPQGLEAALMGQAAFLGRVDWRRPDGGIFEGFLRLSPLRGGKQAVRHVVALAEARDASPLTLESLEPDPSSLPEGQAESSTEEEIRELPRGKPRGRQEAAHLLVVEDDDLVRDLIAKTLLRSGYRVTVAADPLRALEECELHRGTLQLVISDMVLPSISGVELVARLRKMHPGLRVIYTSGYGKEQELQLERDTDQSTFLAKPFTPVELLEVVQESLLAGQRLLSD